MAELEIEKRVKNATLFTNGVIRIDNVRGSYVHLDKPYKGTGDDNANAVAKYSMVGLLPQKTHGEANELINEAIAALLKANKNAKVAANKRFIQDGDDSGRDEYEGHWSVSAREERRVTCRDGDGNKLHPVDDLEMIRDLFRSGYWFTMLIKPWFQDNKYGKRVNAGLIGVKFVKEDEEFGEGSIDDEGAWGDDDDSSSKKSSSKKKAKRTEDDDDDI